MKLFTTILLVLLYCSSWAQKPTFVRVYNQSGKQTYKGNVLAITDTSLLLKQANIPFSDIYRIKTKRSGEHNILVGSIVGASVLGLLFAGMLATAPQDPFTPTFTAGAGFVIGAGLGTGIGAGIGAITILFKDPKSYIINGDSTQWRNFKLATDSVKVK